MALGTDRAMATIIESPTWSPEPMSERIVVRCYSSYVDAKRAVDRLTVGRIPSRRITVVGRGLEWKHAFTAGRMVKGATAGGALTAGLTALVMWFVGAFDGDVTWLGALVAGAVIGAILGVLIGGIAWAVTRRDNTIPETGHVDVGHYDILVELDEAERARQLLDEG